MLGGSGSDDIDAGTDASRDIVIGDNGEATFDSAGVLNAIQTTAPADGGSDEILVGDGSDYVIGGVGNDFINVDRETGAQVGTDSGDDVILGDNGSAQFTITNGQSIASHIETTDPEVAGDDVIFAANGSDIVLGGSGSDDIDAGTDASRDIVVGDNGAATFDADGVLSLINTTDPTDGGSDEILVGDGDDYVIGGVGDDFINVDRETGAQVGTDSGNDVILGDNGSALFTISNGQSIASHIETTNPEVCLLYTSPSPRDATLSRMPSSA